MLIYIIMIIIIKLFFIEHNFHINNDQLLNDNKIKQKILINDKNSKITIDVEYYIKNEKNIIIQ